MFLRIIALIAVFVVIGCSKQVLSVPERNSSNEQSLSKLKEEKQLCALDRMIITTATIHIVSKTPDTVHSKILNLAKELNGYIVFSGLDNMTVRIPSSKFKLSIDKIHGFGRVTEKTIIGKDVTEEYNDVTIKLDNSEKARNRYLELLSKAETVEAALKVERELERLNGEINLLNGKLKYLKELTAYSTITIRISKQIQPGPLGYIFLGAYKAIEWLFVWNY